MKRPHNRKHCSAPDKGIRKNKRVPVAPSGSLHQDYSKYKKVQNRFSSSITVGCGRLSHLDSAPPFWRGFLLSLFLLPISDQFALLSKSSAKGISWHHCFCPQCFHFSCSLLHAKPGFIVGRITEAENAWCLMLCYFNSMISASSVE